MCALEEAASAVFAPLDLQATLDAIVDVLCPQYGDGAYVALLDDRGQMPIVAARHRNGAAGATPAADTALLVPLVAEGLELGALCVWRDSGLGALAPEDAQLVRAFARRSTQAIRNARRFERERSVALAFQHAALVSRLPESEGYRFDAIYRAGQAEALVGGDWYDAFALPDGRYVISIGDVVGSGLDAAIAMVNVRQAIRGVAQIHPDPVAMLDAADKTLRAQHPDRFVTAFVAVIDAVTQQCAFANAGHPAPRLRLTDGSVQQTHGRGFPLGLAFEQQLAVHHIDLPPGSTLILFTDGLIESTRDVAEGEQRLEAALRDPDLAGAHDIAARIHGAVLDGDARDDVAILTVAVLAAPPVRRWHFDPAWHDVANRVHRELCGELRGAGYPEPMLVDVELVFSELIGNLVRHAPGMVEVLLERRNMRFTLHVLDKGPGFEFNPRLPPDLYSEFGRGLFLISRLAREFGVERRPGGGSHARIVVNSGEATTR